MGGGAKLLGTQALGVVSVIAWVAITMTAVFLIIKHTVGLRVTADEEIAGLDIREHGIASSYADFMTFDSTSGASDVELPTVTPAASAEQAPAEKVSGEVSTSAKLTKISIITRQNKLNELMMGLNEIGVTGITVTNVLGCGTQKGALHYYRGAEIDMNLLPKVKVDIVVSKVPVETVIETARRILHTGKIGDGKLFVYNIENVVKVRTGEEGYAALQDTVE